MRVAFMADVHGNLEAAEVMLRYLKRQSIDLFVSLGDSVGYGANPNECIGLVRDFPVHVAGNHDCAAIGTTETSYFNPAAREAIEWTQSVLTPESSQFLNGLPLTASCDDGILAVHASPSAPEEWAYVLREGDIIRELEGLNERTCFIGHSHVPMIAELDGKSLRLYPVDQAELRPNCRYLVNVGSVGQPRDGDPRASACVYDMDEQVLRIVRVPYDVATAQRKIWTAGLPQSLGSRLTVGS